MEKITSISQLKKGDKIWTINTFSGAVDILEFVCIHPHNEEYSIFLNENYDGMPKFYNKHLADGDYERYDASKDCWERIHAKEIAWHERRIQEEVKSLMKRASDGGLRVRDFVRGDFPTPEGFKHLYCQEPKPVVISVGEPSPQKITHNGDIYVRRDVVEHIICGSLGPKEALAKIRSL